MRTLSIDIETFSTVDLNKSGVYAYAEDPDFQVMLFGYAWDDGPVQVVDLMSSSDQFQKSMFDTVTNTIPEIPPKVIAALTDPNVLKTAFNANFERTCLARHFGMSMPPEQWECSMIRAAEAGLPRSLKGAGIACASLGVPADLCKDSAAGSRLIKFFCIPCKPTTANGGRTRNLPKHAPDKWREFIEYNRQDVVAERAVRNVLPPIIESEQRLWALDQHINDRGVMIDRTLVDEMVKLDEAMHEELIKEAKELTGLDNPNSRSQILDWVNANTGQHFENFRKEDLPEILAATNNPEVRRIIEIRQELGKTSTSKYATMQAAACKDNRVRGLTAFYGAPRTGRFSGRLVQLQNLPRNHLEDLDTPRELVKSGNGDVLGLLYESTADTMSQLIRTALIPKPGCKFVVADFSAIEARVLSWLANEEWRLDAFRKGVGIYEASASKMFGIPIERIVKGNPEYEYRQKGKQAELACGYQGAKGALIKMGALEMGLTEDELPGLVTQWREANPNIVATWVAAEKCAREALDLPIGSELYTVITAAGGAKVRFYHDMIGLRIELPSGRSLYYRNAHIQSRDQWGYSTPGIVYNGTGDEATAVATYGGKIIENIIQAIARDCLAVAMERVAAAGLDIVFHVHDEIIVEAKQGSITPSELSELMSQPIDWAPELPLAADGYESTYYKKD